MIDSQESTEVHISQVCCEVNKFPDATRREAFCHSWDPRSFAYAADWSVDSGWSTVSLGAQPWLAPTEPWMKRELSTIWWLWSIILPLSRVSTIFEMHQPPSTSQNRSYPALWLIIKNMNRMNLYLLLLSVTVVNGWPTLTIINHC